jgi:hypothetical protein
MDCRVRGNERDARHATLCLNLIGSLMSLNEGADGDDANIAVSSLAMLSRPGGGGDAATLRNAPPACAGLFERVALLHLSPLGRGRRPQAAG